MSYLGQVAGSLREQEKLRMASNKDIFFLKPPKNTIEIGRFCHKLARQLFPICRSITGSGLRQTLQHLQQELPELVMEAVPSGTKVFDWIVPDEWNIRDAYIADEDGNRIIDFQKHNLHIMGYSEPVDTWLDLENLNNHLFSLEDQPTAIPYITSYYKRNWGFCITHDQRLKLKSGRYHAVVDSDLRPGELNYGELIIPGDSDDEVLLSTYVCHPSMANNELSGPVIQTALAKWLIDLPKRHYTYRLVFIPETIGSITYISKHLDHLKNKVVAGFNLTCLGDERSYSYLPSRAGDTLSDQVALHALTCHAPNFCQYTWLERGSDERQYCSPGVDLPITTISRSKFNKFPEYHTSLDNLDLVTPAGLTGGFEVLSLAISILENNVIPKVTVLCEPQLGKRGLYPNLSTKDSSSQVETMMNIISYCDGNHTLLDIANILQEPVSKIMEILTPLVEEGLVKLSR
jgi:aminopeptidase-like protein